MRVAAQIFLAYSFVLVLASVWRLLPVDGMAPEIAVLFAVHLGITARSRLAAAAVGAAVIGYLADLLTGTPVGLQATVCVLISVAGHLAHRRLLVRGLFITVVFCFFVGLLAGLSYVGLGHLFGITGVGGGFVHLLAVAALTALFGPLVFTVARKVDDRFFRASSLQAPGAR